MHSNSWFDDFSKDTAFLWQTSMGGSPACSDFRANVPHLVASRLTAKVAILCENSRETDDFYTSQ